MTITDIVEPTRDVELGTEVDESSSKAQDTEAEEKSFFQSYADWFIGLVDGDSNDNEGDEAALQQQQQPSSIDTYEDPEQQRSSSRNDIEDDEEEIPPQPPPPNWFFPIDEPITFDRHRCPMILKPFAWLIEIVVVIILTVIHIVFVYILLIIGLFFLGPLFMYVATVLYRERNILMEKYSNEGVSVDGVVMRRYNTWETDVLVENAIVKYEYGNDEYRMKLSPLKEHVKDSIEPHDMIPIVLLRENPESGIPAVCVEDLSTCEHVLYRTFFFSLGLAMSTLWTFLACIVPINYWRYDLRLLIGTILLIGVLPIAFFFFWKGFRDCLSRNLSCFDLKLINDMSK